MLIHRTCTASAALEAASTKQAVLTWNTPWRFVHLGRKAVGDGLSSSAQHCTTRDLLHSKKMTSIWRSWNEPYWKWQRITTTEFSPSSIHAVEKWCGYYVQWPTRVLQHQTHSELLNSCISYCLPVLHPCLGCVCHWAVCDRHTAVRVEGGLLTQEFLPAHSIDRNALR